MQIGDLARALQEGRPPMIPGAEARRAVALVMAIYESARRGKSCGCKRWRAAPVAASRGR